MWACPQVWFTVHHLDFIHCCTVPQELRFIIQWQHCAQHRHDEPVECYDLCQNCNLRYYATIYCPMWLRHRWTSQTLEAALERPSCLTTFFRIASIKSFLQGRSEAAILITDKLLPNPVISPGNFIKAPFSHGSEVLFCCNQFCWFSGYKYCNVDLPKCHLSVDNNVTSSFRRLDF